MVSTPYETMVLVMALLAMGGLGFAIGVAVTWIEMHERPNVP